MSGLCCFLRAAGLSWLVLFLLFTREVQSFSEPLQAARAAADKIIRETTFTQGLALQKPVAAIQHVDFSREYHDTGWAVAYARSSLNVEQPAEVRFGIAGGELLRVWIDGEPVYAGRPGPDRPREIIYDHFLFPDTLRVRLQPGLHPILIKAVRGSGDWAFFLRALPDEKGVLPRIRFQPDPPIAPVDQNWITVGPFSAPDPVSGDTTRFLPEISFEPCYSDGRSFFVWRLPGRFLLPELQVPANSSFRSHTYIDWQYANGATQMALLDLAEAAADSSYRLFVEKSCRLILEELAFHRWAHDSLFALRIPHYRIFRRVMLDDAGAPTLPFVELLHRGRLPQAGDLVDAMAAFVMTRQLRLPDGTFCRLEPEAGTVWADDLFMSVPLLLRMGQCSGDRRYFDESVRQIQQFDRLLYDRSTGLYHHGWYQGRGRTTTVLWGRANGWMAWAITEALLRLPADHPGRRSILAIHRRQMKNLRRFQDDNGMWHQVLDHPASFAETSCSAMFTLAMARGVRLGWLDPSYRRHADRGWAAVQRNVAADGTVRGICQGTGLGESLDFYLTRKQPDHDPRGLGAVITAAIEMHYLENR